MQDERIINAIRCCPDKLHPRDVMYLCSLGIPVVYICKRRDNATKDKILNYILEMTIEYVRYMRQCNFRQLQKALFFLNRDMKIFANKAVISINELCKQFNEFKYKTYGN